MENKPARAQGAIGRQTAGSSAGLAAWWAEAWREPAELKVTLADIEAARRVIADVVLRTPMLPAPKLSALTGADVYVKYENLQVTNSFKDRGALVKLASLSEAERKRGVIAMSAGNHAQAVAYHAARLGIPAIDRNAGNDAIRESGRDTLIRRGSRAARGNRGGSAGALRANSGAARPGSRSPLRRSSNHCRPGHDRARNARRRAGSWMHW